MTTLFHYCSVSSFKSILTSRSIWLSSLSLSNDTMEGRLITQTFEKFVKELTVGSDEIERIREALTFTENLFDGLGFCLSEKPDTLSQWRGYADDGQGFSIGFSKDILERLIEEKMKEEYFHLDKVLYEQSEQEEALRPTFDEVRKIVESGKLKKPQLSFLNALNPDEFEKSKDEYLKTFQKLLMKTSSMFTRNYLLKNGAFSEEAEWRVISYLLKDTTDSAQFRASTNRLIPYRELVFGQFYADAITEIYIGPKNITPVFVVENFLKMNGYKDVLVKRSSATYR